MKHQAVFILNEIGTHSDIQEVTPVSGGDSSEAWKIVTGTDSFFVKYNQADPEDLFEKEAYNLSLLRETGTIRVPEVLGKGSGYIVMEWLEGRQAEHTDEALGRGLARLHQYSGDRFGLDVDNYIGTLPQPNEWEKDWITFFREKRLGFQFRLAEEQGHILGTRRQKMIRLLDNLEKWIPRNPKPALLHGDLWGGNWLAGPDGEPYLIDPAVFYGDSELEIAFTELFGGFSEHFYYAYQEILPLSSLYEERKPLYQLYYLLVHLTAFGEMYGSAVDRILSMYV
ncbi:fructosamine kinase family protein [Bacillus piscicola]|uniref:fructosamine kinase family protein n=1 Tax=Bacillus piscicola TaxID=1632684 RepID=UPI001F0922EB